MQDKIRRVSHAVKATIEGLDMDVRAQQTIEQYPWLLRDDMLQYYCMVTYQNDFRRSIHGRLADLAAPIFEYGKTRPKAKKAATDLEKRWNDVEVAHLPEHQRRGALWILPLLLHEDPAFIMSEEKNDSVETPVAVGVTDSAIVRLFLKGVNVVRDTQMDVVDAVAAVMAVYYAYQTDYPANAKKTLTFIERELLHLRDSKPLSSVLTLKKCLERFAKQP